MENTTLRVDSHINFLGFLCMEDLSILPHLTIYSINHLYQYELLDIYFILWVITQYQFIFLIKQCQLWWVGALSVCSLCPFAMFSSRWGSVKYFLTFWHYNMLQPHFLPQFQIQLSLQGALWLENGVRNEYEGTKCVHCYWGFTALGPVSREIFVHYNVQRYNGRLCPQCTPFSIKY